MILRSLKGSLALLVFLFGYFSRALKCCRCKMEVFRLAFRKELYQFNTYHHFQLLQPLTASLVQGTQDYHKMIGQPSCYPSHLVWRARSQPIEYGHQSQSKYFQALSLYKCNLSHEDIAKPCKLGQHKIWLGFS